MQGFAQFLSYATIATAVLMVASLIYGMWGGRRPALAIGLSLVALGVVFTLGLGRSQLRLALFGAHAVGQVVDIEPVRRGFRPIVEFTTSDEETISFDGATVGDQDYYDIWQKVHVRYLQDDPEFAEIQSWNSMWFPMIIGSSVIVLILLLGGWLVWGDLTAKRRQAPAASSSDS